MGLESINSRLSIAAGLLDQAAEEIRDSNFLPTYINIECIGKALNEIFQLQSRIYEIDPKLKPEYLIEPSSHPEADELLTKFIGEAIELEQNENIDAADVIEWAWSDVPFGVVSCTNNEENIMIFGLAICKHPSSQQFYRFSCNAEWETEQDACYDSVEAAKEELPIQYRQVEAKWKKY